MPGTARHSENPWDRVLARGGWRAAFRPVEVVLLLFTAEVLWRVLIGRRVDTALRSAATHGLLLLPLLAPTVAWLTRRVVLSDSLSREMRLVPASPEELALAVRNQIWRCTAACAGTMALFAAILIGVLRWRMSSVTMWTYEGGPPRTVQWFAGGVGAIPWGTAVPVEVTRFTWPATLAICVIAFGNVQSFLLWGMTTSVVTARQLTWFAIALPVMVLQVVFTLVRWFFFLLAGAGIDLECETISSIFGGSHSAYLPGLWFVLVLECLVIVARLCLIIPLWTRAHEAPEIERLLLQAPQE